jgi:hypothetical protein
LNVHNPRYKQQVGEAIYPFVESYIGKELAGKVTGMLIDMDINLIATILTNYNEFISYSRRAHKMIVKELKEQSKSQVTN